MASPPFTSRRQPRTRPVTQPGYVRSFNRFELKYVVTHDAMRAFERDLEGYTRRDAHDTDPRGYEVESVYWDSPELTFFWEKIDGQKFRRKLRSRRYGAGSESGFVEIKQRTDRTVQKRRMRAPLAEVGRFFDGLEDGGEAAFAPEDPVLQEALFLRSYYNLHPIAAVRYRRKAYFGLFERDLRITFDTGLAFGTHAIDIAGEVDCDRSLLDPRLAILEIKFDERAPLWLVRLVESHGLELVRFSKYCAAVDLEYFEGRFSQWTN